VPGRTAVGLDIGTSGVRAAELSRGKAAPTLTRFGQVALPEGAVRDGEVVDVAAVAEAIRALWSATKFKTKRVAVGVANSKVVVRQVDLPWMPAAELRPALAYQVQDYIPMPVDQAILDFHPLAETTNEAGGRMLRVLLVAAARDMVQTSIEAVQRGGLEPVMVDLTPFAVLRALADVPDLPLGPGSAEALVDVGASVTNIVVQQNGAPRFVRILLMGGSDITEAVAERMGIPLEQAEAIKQSTGLTAAGEGMDPGIAARAIETSASAFLDEVRGSLRYYQSQPGSARISRIRLTGGGSQLPGLVERLGAINNLPVERGEAFGAVRLGNHGLSEEQLAFVTPMACVPVGLAMGVAS